MPVSFSHSFDLSPVRLSYVAALHGVVPADFDAAFSFAQIGVFNIEDLMCLAASNPEGAFYGLLPTQEMASKGQELASLRQVTNLSFLSSAEALPDSLDYICCESSQTRPTAAQRDFWYSLAEKKLADSGLFCCRYRAYDNADDTLRFLITEYAPDLNPEQRIEFLSEIKDLGTLYFADHPIARTTLEKALESKNTEHFFETCGQGDESISGTFAAMSGLLPRGFCFVSDADIGKNYMDLVAPVSSQPILAKCRDHLLYEPIKDFVLQRLVRSDVWVKLPANQSLEKPRLFNKFTFGITSPQSELPQSIKTQSGAIALNTPLFMRLIDLMSTLPVGIGDFLAHPMGMGMDTDEVVNAIQVLVASGIARPMRGRYEGQINADMASPKWSTGFNEYLTHTTFCEPTVRAASPIVGEAIELSACDALVLQAVNRVGTSLSAGVLQPEIKRLLANNPTLARQILGTNEPTDEVIHGILSTSLVSNVSRWYAYGLLAA